MANLTSKELGLIEDNLRQEQLMVQKYSIYANQASDHEVKNMCTKLRDLHQQHTDVLMKHLNDAAQMQ